MSGSVSLIDGHIDEVRICPVCGKAFVPSHGNQKYCCPDCALKAKLQKDRQYKAEGRHKSKKPKAEPIVLPRTSVKSKPLGSLSGEELLHYGQIQQGMNMDALRVHIPKE